MPASVLFLYSAVRRAFTRAHESLRLHGAVAECDAHCLPSEAAEHASRADAWATRDFRRMSASRPSAAQQMQLVQWRVSAAATLSRDFRLDKSFFKGCQVQLVCPLSQEGVEVVMAVSLEAVSSTKLLRLSRNLLTRERN